MVIKLYKRDYIIDLLFFFSYPVLCSTFLLFRLPRIWSDRLVAVYGFVAFFSSIMFIGIEEEEGIHQYTVLYMAWAALIFHVLPTIRLGDSNISFIIQFWGSILLAHITSFLLLLLNKRIRIFKPNNGLQVILYWFIFIYSTSILTYVNLVEVNSLLTLFPFVVFGLVFGWFSREFGHRIYRSELGRWGGLGIQVLMMFVTGIPLLWFIPENSNLYFLTTEYESFFPSIFWMIPTMLVSRLTSEYLKSLRARYTDFLDSK